MPQQRFEDYGLTGGIASEKAAHRLKAQTEASPAQAQQQHEDQKTTQDIEAGRASHAKRQRVQLQPAERGVAAVVHPDPA